MQRHIADVVQQIETSSIAAGNRQASIETLRQLGLNDFLNALWEMPKPEFPKASASLPPMASKETQARWTGSSGEILMRATLSFVRAAAANYAEITGQTLRDKKILDFGCGYGRMLRAFAYYSNNVVGVDPWSESIKVCTEAKLPNVHLSDYLPKSLPVDTDFDFAFAFSVFTHLSKRATTTSLAAIRKHMKTGGVLCVTIRPIEYWRSQKMYAERGESWLQSVEKRHVAEGFVFAPHQREAVDGDITYGDTSMTVDYLKSIATGWGIAAMDRSSDDLMQRYMYLRAV